MRRVGARGDAQNVKGNHLRPPPGANSIRGWLTKGKLKYAKLGPAYLPGARGWTFVTVRAGSGRERHSVEVSCSRGGPGAGRGGSAGKGGGVQHGAVPVQALGRQSLVGRPCRDAFGQRRLAPHSGPRGRAHPGRRCSHRGGVGHLAINLMWPGVRSLTHETSREAASAPATTSRAWVE